MIVRQAVAGDAEQASDVLRRSIRELCILDHGGDEGVLTQWLSNKTTAMAAKWIEDPAQHVVVAEQNGGLIGVGSVSNESKITLLYVAPDARFRGVSKGILGALEAHLGAMGSTRCTLSSTRTALRFYASAGYQEVGEPQAWGKLVSQPMEKILG